MIVSNFYLEYGSGFTVNPAYVSGYELEVTNLSDKLIQFEVVARVTRYSSQIFTPPESTATTLANLKELISGVKKNDRWNWFTGGWRHDADGFALHITIPIAPGTSELFDIIPSLYQSRSWWPRIAGHIELSVPVVRSAEPPYVWVPQATDPVPVLLNPSTVEIWEVLKAGGAFADSRTSPPLTTGKAHNEIPPDTHLKPIRISIRDYLATVRDLGAAGLAQGAVGLSSGDRAQALIDLLAAVGEDEAEQAALNEVLEGLGSSARVVQSRGQDSSAD
jgi:hypothetical protein